jgi:hypothetical protein
MMEMDAESLRASGYGERSAERMNSRNGFVSVYGRRAPVG